ncbi:MAG: hypothetical protein AAF065_03250 [Verrucomicrobiota bacterium]
MKNKTTYILAGAVFAASTASAEIPLTDDLSAYGYIDVVGIAGDDEFTSIDNALVAEFELGFSFTPVDSQWSAVAELSFNGTDNNFGADNFDFETVTITYAYSDELSFTVGNILSYQGFETFDATGLYQFSYLGVFGNPVYTAGYWVGASIDYVTDAYAAGVWVGDNNAEDASWEIFLQYTGIEGLTASFIYADDPDYETINPWISYEIDAFTFAVEYVDNEFSNGVEQDFLMLLAYYSFGDAGITVRFTDGDNGGVSGVDDFKRYTISPSYSFSDNVLGLLEYSVDDIDGSLGTVDQYAAELIFTF